MTTNHSKFAAISAIADMVASFCGRVDALSAEEYFSKGENAAMNNLNELAIKYYKKAVSGNLKFVKAYGSMGNAYTELKNYREAIERYQKAIAINPNEAGTYYNMGVAYGYLGNKQEQIKRYQQAARLGHQDTQKWLRENGYSW